MSRVEVLDTVALTVDRPEYGLLAGDDGRDQDLSD